MDDQKTLNFMVRGLDRLAWRVLKVYAYENGISLNDWVKEQINAGITEIQREGVGEAGSTEVEGDNEE